MPAEYAYLGGGCFWCLEAAFQQINGILHVESGYAGGSRIKPSYQQVCNGLTGHAEVVKITFDPAVITFAQILEFFFALHDPTSVDRQGADIGSQYRSIILFDNEAQRQIASQVMEAQSSLYVVPLATELEPLKDFWPAEPEHQDFYRRNPEYGYCRVVISPKLKKLRELLAKR